MVSGLCAVRRSRTNAPPLHRIRDPGGRAITPRLGRISERITGDGPGGIAAETGEKEISITAPQAQEGRGEMTAPVTHKQIYRPSPFGGIVNTTLCGRVSHADDDGMNVGDQVTCKLCLRRIAQAEGQ